MRKRTTKEEASQMLRDVPHEHSFWVNGGSQVRNLYDLAMALEEMNDGTYVFHVNSEKNDFGNWLMDVVNDHKLAKDMGIAMNRGSAARKVRNRIGLLKGML